MDTTEAKRMITETIAPALERIEKHIKKLIECCVALALLGAAATILSVYRFIAVIDTPSSLYAGAFVMVFTLYFVYQSSKARRRLQVVWDLQNQILAIDLEQDELVLSRRISDLVIGMVDTFGYKDKWDF